MIPSRPRCRTCKLRLTLRRLPNLLARFQGGGVNDVPGIGLALIGFSLSG